MFEVNQSTQTVQIDSEQIRAALKTNAEFFFNFFIGEELKFAVPEFHKICWEWLINVEIIKIALALPRGHAKTTLAKLAVIWYWLFSHVRFIVYVSNTAPIAKDAARDIINMIESDNFKRVFGEVVFEKRSEGEGIYIFWLGDKRCILKALGAGQQIRGMNVDNRRPEFAVIDDLEDHENIGTPYLLAKLRRWVYGTFFKAMDQSWNKILWLGNMISNDCILKSLCESKQWQSMRLGALLSTGDTLWPELWPIEKLTADFEEYEHAGQVHTWFAEMMNQPIPEGMGLIDSADMKFAPLRAPPDINGGFITIDPAIGESKLNDKSAIAVHGIVEGVPEVVDYAAGHFGPELTVDISIEFCYKWGVGVIGVEIAGYQAALMVLFKLVFAMRNIYGIEIVPLRYGRSKLARLKGFWALNKRGEYLIPEDASEIVSQAIGFDPQKQKNDDDLIDTIAYGPQMMEEYIGLVLEHFDKTIIEDITHEKDMVAV